MDSRNNMPDMKHMVRRYLYEILSGVALVLAGLSAWMSWFMGGPSLSLWGVIVGTAFGLGAPTQVNRLIHQFYYFTYRKARVAEFVIGIFKIVLGIFIPFAYFLAIGLLAGSAYHYFNQTARRMQDSQDHDV